MKKCLSLLVLFAALSLLDADELRLDVGRIDKLTYTNDYFGLQLTVPEKWQIQDSEARDRLMKVGKEVIAGDNQNMKAMLDVSEQNAVNLLTLFKFPLGAAVDFNPSLVCVAEKVSQLPGIKKGSDYLFHVRKLLESGQLKYKFDDQVYSEKIGGTDFDFMITHLDVRNISLTQKYYASIQKGYALGFVLSSSNEIEAQEVHKILQTVNFHSKAGNTSK
jgi:hypothetical protein